MKYSHASLESQQCQGKQRSRRSEHQIIIILFFCDFQGCDAGDSEDVDHDHVVHFGDDQDDDLSAVDDDVS